MYCIGILLLCCYALCVYDVDDVLRVDDVFCVRTCSMCCRAWYVVVRGMLM